MYREKIPSQKQIEIEIDFTQVTADYKIITKDTIYQLDLRTQRIWDVYIGLRIKSKVTAVASEKKFINGKPLVVLHFANNELFCALHWAIHFGYLVIEKPYDTQKI